MADGLRGTAWWSAAQGAGTDDARWRGGVATQYRRMARVSLACPLAELTGLPTFVDNDAKALALGEGWIGAAAGSSQLHRNGRLDRCRWRHRPRRAAARRASGQRRSRRACHRGARGSACRCGGRGCLEAEASGTALAAITGQPARLAPVRGGANRDARRPRLASVVNLLDLPLAVVSGSVALGSAGPSSRRRKRRWTGGAGSISPVGRGSSPVVSVTAARWSGRPASACAAMEGA